MDSHRALNQAQSNSSGGPVDSNLTIKDLRQDQNMRAMVEFQLGLYRDKIPALSAAPNAQQVGALAPSVGESQEQLSLVTVSTTPNQAVATTADVITTSSVTFLSVSFVQTMPPGVSSQGLVRQGG